MALPALNIADEQEARVYLGFSRLHRLPGSLLLVDVVLCNALVGMGRKISGMGNHRCTQRPPIGGLQGTRKESFRGRARHTPMVRTEIPLDNSQLPAFAIGDRL